jgi:hypothetical protein
LSAAVTSSQKASACCAQERISEEVATFHGWDLGRGLIYHFL